MLDEPNDLINCDGKLKGLKLELNNEIYMRKRLFTFPDVIRNFNADVFTVPMAQMLRLTCK